MLEADILKNVFLEHILIALALGILVGMERDGAPGNKFAGVRTLSLLCAGGALSVLVSRAAASVLPVVVFLVLGGLFSLVVVSLRVWTHQDDLGMTTSATVFLMALVGVLVGYDYLFEAVSTTLIAVFLLTEKNSFARYADLLTAEEISDAVKLGILSLVLYPILPPEPVDPWGVLYLQKGLLFMIFILFIQFAAFVSLKWLQSSIGFLFAAGLGGIVSSLAVVTSMCQFAKKQDLADVAFVGAIMAVIAAIVRNGVFAVVLGTGMLDHILIPFAVATVVGILFALYSYDKADDVEDVTLGAESPFSFMSAFKFGILFLSILLVAELAQDISHLGVYGAAFLGGIGSSTAVVASAATLQSAEAVTAAEASIMVVLGIISSMVAKIGYAQVGGATTMAKRLLIPYLLIGLALLGVLL